ncbi:MAG: hypothetical protein KDA66_05825 [Planctomycetaceae bacterium]|nr:hypothetical protein [Planctomycetaceae bacterium]
METEAPSIRPRRRWLYLLAVLALCCVLGIVVWKWTRRPPAFDITGSWLTHPIPASSSSPAVLTFVSDGSMLVDNAPAGRWWMEGNEVCFGGGIRPFGARGLTIPVHLYVIEYVVEQDPNTGEVVFSPPGQEPTMILTRINSSESDDPDTPTE